MPIDEDLLRKSFALFVACEPDRAANAPRGSSVVDRAANAPLGSSAVLRSATFSS